IGPQLPGQDKARQLRPDGARHLRRDPGRERRAAARRQDSHDWPYFAGDGAVQGSDGYFRIPGRVDDVINVAGHRLDTKELESSALMVEEVAEAAVVPVIDD